MNESISEDSQPEELNNAITRRLDEQVARIDASTSQRLKTARRRAIQQQRPSEHRGPLHFASRLFDNQLKMPLATVFTGAAAMMLTVFLWQANPTTNSPASASIDDISTLENTPVLSASDDLEFFGSIDFLVWMENNTG